MCARMCLLMFAVNILEYESRADNNKKEINELKAFIEEEKKINLTKVKRNQKVHDLNTHKANERNKDKQLQCT